MNCVVVDDPVRQTGASSGPVKRLADGRALRRVTHTRHDRLREQVNHAEERRHRDRERGPALPASAGDRSWNLPPAGDFAPRASVGLNGDELTEPP